MNNWKVKNKRQNLQFEIDFTKAYRDAVSKYNHPAQIELACLKAQFPAIMHEIEDNDLIAGRLEFGAVGLGVQHNTGGFGFYMDKPKVLQALENQTGSAKYREDLHDMLVFWYSENSSAKVMADMPENIRKALPSEDWENLPLPANPILRIAGSYLNFDKLVQQGIPGLLKEMDKHLEREKVQNGDTILFECLIGSLNLLKDVCLFYHRQALEKMELFSQSNKQRAAELKKMADTLLAITERAPANMHEAIQLVWLYGLMAPQVEFGRADVYLGDLYVNDIENGTLTDEDALKLVQSYFRLIDHLDCEVDGRVIVGGYGRRNKENADKFCLVAIEACRTVIEVLPQFTLRFNKETPKDVWDAAMQCIEEGRTFPLLYNDDMLVPAIMKAYNVDRARAETYVPLGCGEIEFDHYSFGTPSGAINVLKILEIAINGGYEPVGRCHIGPSTKRLDECANFEEFYENFKQHLDFYIKAQAEFEMYQYKKVGELHAFMYFTMLYDECCDKGKAVFNGGCASLNGTVELYGLINSADSLTAIKKLVFDSEAIDAKQLMDILKANFYGYEKQRKMMLDCPKYGNDHPEADEMVISLQKYMCDVISKQADVVGLDTNLSVLINNAQNTTLARWVGASPDGRKAGTPTANANNPSPGSDKNGITALINSILKMPHDNNAGTVQNLRFTRELFDTSREKVHQLIDGYFERGGAHAMITVVGRNELKKAIDNPEKYPDLIVRVGGFSARFVDLAKDVQQEVYQRVTY